MFPNWPLYTPEHGDKVRVLAPESLFGSALDGSKPYFIQQLWYGSLFVSEDAEGSSKWVMIKEDQVVPWTNAARRSAAHAQAMAS